MSNSEFLKEFFTSNAPAQVVLIAEGVIVGIENARITSRHLVEAVTKVRSENRDPCVIVLHMPQIMDLERELLDGWGNQRLLQVNLAYRSGDRRHQTRDYGEFLGIPVFITDPRRGRNIPFRFTR